jgi:hypothetical protein
VKIVYAINIKWPSTISHFLLMKLISFIYLLLLFFFVVINCTTIAITTRHVVYNVYYTFFSSLRDIIFYIIIVNGKKRNKRIIFFSVSLFSSRDVKMGMKTSTTSEKLLLVDWMCGAQAIYE